MAPNLCATCSCCSQSYGNLKAEPVFWDFINIFLMLHQKCLTAWSRNSPLCFYSVDAPFEFWSRFFVIFPQSLQANSSIRPQLLPSELCPIHRTTVILQPTLCIPDSLEYWELCWKSHKNNLTGITWALPTIKKHRNPKLPFRSLDRHERKMTTDEALTIIRRWAGASLQKFN